MSRLRQTPDIPHEQTFATDVASIINQILAEAKDLPFSRATTEISARGSRTRRDLTLYDTGGKPALTGELKLPYRPDGRSPYNFGVVRGAADKAVEAGVRYFFTWNVNTFVLWDLNQAGKPLIQRDQEKREIAEVGNSDELQDPGVYRDICEFWRTFLVRFSQLLSGEKPLMVRSLDERFIDILDSALKSPQILIRAAAGYRYQTDPEFKLRLNRWMSRQGMRVFGPEITANIQRTAKISAYVLASRLMFYKALHRRFQLDLRALRVPSSVTSVGQLRARFERYFREAEKVTGDYETIFRGDELDDLPYLTDDLVQAWRGLVDDIQGFDFTELDYDLIGPIFERLIAPEERHRWGQHYTKPEVCDIMNAFVIRSATDSLLDPACGGGTFLVRAYARKSYLARRSGRTLSHQELLSQINGIDLSLYAATIATVNLATRSLEDDENYPRIAATDFFDATPHRSMIHSPHGPPKWRPTGEEIYPNLPLPNTAIGHVDVVVGNPPYIRQERLDEHYKRKLSIQASKSPVPLAKPPGRSDIHLYFWPHAAAFLKDGGRIALLTSSNWLDTEYGAALQEWMLCNFRIVAILESSVEPWFTGARVATAITVLEHEVNEAARAENAVRFVQIRKPLTEMLNDCASEDDRLKRTEDFVGELLGAKENLLTPEYRLRLVSQGELAIGETPTESGEEEHPSKLITGKWGMYLRAPDLLFQILNRFEYHLVPLGQVASIKRGITSGADEFFFIRDVTDDWLRDKPGAIKENFGIKPEETDRVRLVAVSDGTIHPIEARFLVPEVHRLAEVTGYAVDSSSLPRRMVAISETMENLAGTHAAAYIRWGQRGPRRFHKRSTCTGRDPWYDVTGFDTPTILWSMSHKYRHIAPFNPERVVPNHNLFGIRSPEGIDDDFLCAILNSTLVGWLKCFVSRPMGTEGFKTEVVDVRKIPIPDPRNASTEVQSRIQAAFAHMRQRQAFNLIDELDLEDRQELDDAVFELLGASGATERKRFRAELYSATRSLYQSLRHVEVQATHNRSRTARRSKVTPHDIAMEIWDELDKTGLSKFPEGFLPPEEGEMEAIEIPSRVTHVDVGASLFAVDAGGESANQKPTLVAGSVQVNDDIYDLGSLERAQYLEAMIISGRIGRLHVPVDPSVCGEAVSKFRTYRAQLKERVQQLAEEHAGVGKLADQVAATLEAICLRLYGWQGWRDLSVLHEDHAEYEFED